MFNKIIKKINFSVIIFLIIMMPATFLLRNYLDLLFDIHFNVYDDYIVSNSQWLDLGANYCKDH